MTGFRFTLKLTPHGRLVFEESSDAHELAPELGKRLQDAFSRGPGFGLLQLGAREVSQTVPAVFTYWREFAARFVATLCTRTTADDAPFTTPGLNTSHPTYYAHFGSNWELLSLRRCPPRASLSRSFLNP
jgi:hypothetical protein